MYCPYCYEPIRHRVLVCRSSQCAMYEQSLPDRPPRLRARLPERLRIRGGARLADREIRCDVCGQPCACVCESCGREIPAAWLRYPAKNVLFLGMSGVGKSTLLASSKLALSGLKGFVFSPLEAENTAERFYDRYTGPLTERQAQLPHTENELPMPFLWGASCRRGPSEASACTLAVYDVPGEMVHCHADIAPVERLLALADSVVLAVNPASLPQVRDACGQAAAHIEPAPDAWERAERILDELLVFHSIGTRCGVKLAVVLTHLDVWFASLKDCASASALNDPYLRQLVAGWRGSAFLSRLSEFRDQRLFATGLYRGGETLPLTGAQAPMGYLMERMGLRLPAGARIRG